MVKIILIADIGRSFFTASPPVNLEKKEKVFGKWSGSMLDSTGVIIKYPEEV